MVVTTADPYSLVVGDSILLTRIAGDGDLIEQLHFPAIGDNNLSIDRIGNAVHSYTVWNFVCTHHQFFVDSGDFLGILPCGDIGNIAIHLCRDCGCPAHKSVTLTLGLYLTIHDFSTCGSRLKRRGIVASFEVRMTLVNKHDLVCYAISIGDGVSRNESTLFYLH